MFLPIEIVKTMRETRTMIPEDDTKDDEKQKQHCRDVMLKLRRFKLR